MAGWKIPELNGGFIRKITDKWFIFQHAMFDDTGGYRGPLSNYGAVDQSPFHRNHLFMPKLPGGSTQNFITAKLTMSDPAIKHGLGKSTKLRLSLENHPTDVESRLMNCGDSPGDFLSGY